MKKIMLTCFALIIVASSFYFMKKRENIETDSVSDSLDQNLSESIKINHSENLPVDDEITEINETQYVGFINDLYENPNDYKDQPFRIRGHYRTREVDGITKHYIFQGTDERWVGLEINFADGYPTEGSIVQVVGIIKVKTDNVPFFELSSMTMIREGKK